MAICFDVPDELAEFLFQAATAAAEVVNREYSHLSPIGVLQVFGPGKGLRLSMARQIMGELTRWHVWYHRQTAPPYSGDALKFCISMKWEPPFGEHSVPITYAMLSKILDRPASTFVFGKNCRAKAVHVEDASLVVREAYGPGDEIVVDAICRDSLT